jgi:hypothetical protein
MLGNVLIHLPQQIAWTLALWPLSPEEGLKYHEVSVDYSVGRIEQYIVEIETRLEKEITSGAILIPKDKSKDSVIHARVKELHYQASLYFGLPIPL